MTNARPENYWIAPDALYITLNAMGQPDYLQGNVSSGAVIMCYMCGIDGLSFDAGHNYRRWPLAVAPTYFNTSTPKYVYAAIPKSEAVNAYAQIVYPSEKIDLYGKNAKGEQIGVEGYYFVFLQGIISASVATDGTTQMRSWTQRVDCGSLASDEAIAAGGTDAWWKYSSVDDTVTFLKTIAKAVFDNITAKIATIAKLILNGHEINGVSSANTPVTSDDTLVTPKYGETKWLSKEHDDETKSTLGMNVANIDDRAKSTNFDNHAGFPFGTGWAAIKDDGTESHASMLEVDKLFVRMKAYFAELEIRKISYLGGNYVFSSAGGKIYYVEWLDANHKILEQTEANKDLVKRFRCYLYSDDGTTQTMNWFKEDDQVRCQNFGDLSKNAKAANGVITATDHTTHYWWRRVNAVGNGAIAAKGDKRTYQYIEFLNDPGQYGADSDFPEIGDAMVQFGNWTTASRQGVIMIVVTGDDAPAIIEWQDVGANRKHFTMPEKEYTRLSPRGDGNVIRGKFISVSGTTTDHTGQSLDEQITALVEQLNDIKNQADKKFDIWFNGGEPHPNSATDTETNAPASDWKTDAEKGLHAQDLYYDTDKEPASKGGRAWRWMAHNTGSAVSYYWDAVTDKDTTDALDKAIDLQNQVDDIASDGIISHGSEKSQLLIEWNKALANFKKYSTLADTYALTSKTEWHTYKANFFNLAVMLNDGKDYTSGDANNSTIPNWLSTDLNKDTKVNADTYRQTWKAHNDAFAAFLELLSTKTKDLVDNAQITADSKVQTFVRDSTTPPNPPFKTGDFWIQTDKDNNVMVCTTGKNSGDNKYVVGDYWADLSDIYGNTPDVRTILATLADKVWTLVGESYLEQHSNSYIDVYIGSQPTSSVYDSDISYYNGVLYERKNGSWAEIENSGYENTFVTVMAMLGTIKIRVFNYSTPPSPKLYDLALAQISIQDPVDGQVTKGNYEIMMYNEKGVWEVLRSCTLAIMKSYGDHIVGLVAGSEETLSGRIDSLSGTYATKDAVETFSRKFTFDKDGNVVNIKKSGLLTTADGNLLYAKSVRNLIMGATTGTGWYTALGDMSANGDDCALTFKGYYFIASQLTGSQWPFMDAPILRVTAGKRYVLSFKASLGYNLDEVNFLLELHFGSTAASARSASSKFVAGWSSRLKRSSYTSDDEFNNAKAFGQLIQSSADSSRFFFAFTAPDDMSYLCVRFVEVVKRTDQYVTDNFVSYSKSKKDSQTVNSAWPSTWSKTIPSGDVAIRVGNSTVTMSEDGHTRYVETPCATYQGQDAGPYETYTLCETYIAKPVSLTITKPQLEETIFTEIKDIQPSEYKAEQNIIESYIQQTADSIRIKANTVVINDKFWVDSNGDVHMNNAHLAGVLSSGSGVKQITIGGNDQNGEINVGGYITLHYDANIEGDKIYGVSVNGSGGVITVKGTPANKVYLNYQPTQITGYSVYSMGAYFRGLMVSKDGIDVTGGSLRLSSISSGSVAISNDSDGYIKGARFKTETLNTSKSYAYETDVRNIICTNTSAITIQLPSSPVLGDELIIIQEGAKIDFISPSIKFKYSNRDIGTTANSNSTGQLNYFLFDGTYWHVRYIKVGCSW